MKKKVLLISICLVIIAFLFIRGIYHRIEKGESSKEQENPIQTQESITRAQAAKMIAMLSYSESEIEALDRIITYQDTDGSKWYDKYINGIVTLGFKGDLSTKENKFYPLEQLDYEDCIILLESMGYQGVIKELSFTMEEKGKNKLVKKTQWMELYDVLIHKLEIEHIEKKELYIIGPPDSSDSGSSQIVTDEGTYGCQGITFEDSKDKKFLVYTRSQDSFAQDEIIAIYEEADAKVSLENAWLIEGKGQTVKAFFNGCTRNFQTKSPLSEPIKKVVGDLVIENGIVVNVNIKPEIISGKVLVANDTYIEVEGYGKLKLSESYRIYRTYDELAMELTNAILVGYSTTDFVMAQGKICAALIKESIHAKNIRVLIKTKDFEELVHNEVKLTVNCDYTVYYEKKKKNYKKGEEITFTVNSRLLKKGRIRIEPNKEKGRITLLSITRNGEKPSYRGSMEIAIYENGLTIVNELPLEEYLYAVIPSEMPTSYDIEALKVQAICARSYAYKQLLTNSCGKYGAHVDDSVSYQVYNNIPENDASILAVKDTYGEVLEYQKDVISAYYFSTSCGYTSSADEVWISTKPLVYLLGTLQAKNKVQSKPDLTKEKEFRDFITKDTYETYDSEFAWYRWKVEINQQEIKRVVDENLKSRYEANPNLIQTKMKDGTFKSIPIETVGTILDIDISQRKTGGIVTQVIIKGSKETIKVSTEYNIRKLLAPRYDKVIRQDKSIVENLSMLPSAFIFIDPMQEEDGVKGFTFTGGGYGHGVGMSQNGVKAMADGGKKYKEILQHYYKGIEIGYLY